MSLGSGNCQTKRSGDMVCTYIAGKLVVGGGMNEGTVTVSALACLLFVLFTKINATTERAPATTERLSTALPRPALPNDK